MVPYHSFDVGNHPRFSPTLHPMIKMLLSSTSASFSGSMGSKLCCFIFCLAFLSPFPSLLQAQPYVYPGSGVWNPPSANGSDYVGTGYAIPMDAIVSETPAEISVRIFHHPVNDLGKTFYLFRKDPFVVVGGWSLVGSVVAGESPTSIADTNVTVGQLYEYGLGIEVGGNPPAQPSQSIRGNLLAGIKVDRTLPQGRMAVVVAEDILERLPSEYAQYKSDLEADGWVVHEIVVPRASSYASNSTALGAITSVGVGGGGTGYTNSQTVILSNGTRSAAGTLVVSSGAITSVTVTHSAGGFAVGESLTMTENTTGSGVVLTVGSISSTMSPHVAIRNELIDISNEFPAELKNVVLLGKVPVPRSGAAGSYPDGHIPTKAAWGADAYYADLDGVWPDSASNVSLAKSQSTLANFVKDGKLNFPGDDKFDPMSMSGITGPNKFLELGFGRVDLSNSVPGEYEGLRMYFNKLHRYKTAAPDFQAGRKGVFRFQGQPGGYTQMVPVAFFRSIPGVLGMENVTLIRNSDRAGVPEGADDGENDSQIDLDSQYSAMHGPFLFFFKSSKTPSSSVGGKAVFWTGLQSHYGFWFLENTGSTYAMQRRLAEDNFALSWTWTVGTEYLYHRMSMGFDIGDMMKVSMSGRTGASIGGQQPSYGGYADPALYMNHMGCPSLRLFMFEPPSDLSVVPDEGQPALSWTASPAEGVSGYHVYRSDTEGGPYTRITTEPVAETSYTDSSVSSAFWHYMVRAVRLETSGGGTFWNASLGVTQSLDLDNDPALPEITTEGLPDANWDLPYSFQLSASGGTPLFSWAMAGGSLPPGLNLSPDGLISGNAMAAGDFQFTVRATDHFGQQVEKLLSLTVQSENLQTLYAEANQWANSLNSTKGSGNDTGMKISGPAYRWQSLLRFGLENLQPHNTVLRAKLVLSISEKTPPANYMLVKAALAELGADWAESTLTMATFPPDEPGIEPASMSTLARPYEYVEFDVTDHVLRALENNPSQKITFRFFSTTQAGFGNEVHFVTRNASGNARPRLIIETSDAPDIDVQTPTISPAVIQVGSSLQIDTEVTPLPGNGPVALQWTKASGPGSVVFGSATSDSTSATFSNAGDYVLRLAASDGILTAHRDVKVRVLDVPGMTAPAIGPTEGLVLRLPFDETSGTSVSDVGPAPATVGSLTTIGAPPTLPTWDPAAGRIGGALNLAGSGQRAEIPDSAGKPLDGMTQMTLSVWLKMTDHSGLATPIVVKRTSGTASTTSYSLTLSTARRLTAAIGTRSITASGINQLAVGEWYHVVMVFDGSDPTQNLKVYLNGMPEIFGHAIDTTTIARRDTTPLRIGDYTTVPVANTSSFQGLIDEVRLYNRALNQEEITDLYRAAPANVGPQILLGSDVSGETGQPIALGASVVDDGLPGPLQLQWSMASGPGSVSFADATEASTTATADAAGEYALRLFASDGAITTWKDLLAVVTGASLNAGYLAWLEANNLPTDGSGLGAPHASAKGDGIANAIKYALGLDADADGYAGRLSTEVLDVEGEDYLSLTYVIPDPALPGVGYAVKVGGDLTAWAEDVTEVSNTVEGGLRTITVRDSQPIGPTHPKRFIRLEVNLE